MFRFRAVEFIFDLKWYFIVRLENRKAIFAGFPFKIKKSKPTTIVFGCGIGDAVYGFPALKSLSEEIRASQGRLEAAVESKTTNFANPVVKELLEATGFFDRVIQYHARKTICWKYADIDGLAENFPKNQIFPFIYRTSAGSPLSRVDEVARQFRRPMSLPWPEISWPNSALLSSFTKTTKPLVILHMETRSGNYDYPYMQKLSHLLAKSAGVLGGVQWLLFSTTPQPHLEIPVIDPREMSIAQQIGFLRDHASSIVAINSYLWPISLMLDIPLYGIHYLDSDDASHLCAESTPLLTPASYVVKKHKNAALAKEGVDYSRCANPDLIDYFPETILDFLNKFYKKDT